MIDHFDKEHRVDKIDLINKFQKDNFHFLVYKSIDLQSKMLLEHISEGKAYNDCFLHKIQLNNY